VELSSQALILLLILISGPAALAFSARRRRAAERAARRRFLELGKGLDGQGDRSGFTLRALGRTAQWRPIHAGGQLAGFSIALELTGGSSGPPPGAAIALDLGEGASEGGGASPAAIEASSFRGMARPWDAGRRKVRGSTVVLLRRETPLDRLKARLGHAREPLSGDDAFDQRVLVESSAAEEDVREVLADERLRRGVLDLLDLGFHSVVIDGPDSLIEATIPVARMPAVDSELILCTLEGLGAAAAGLPSFAYTRGDVGGRPRQRALPEPRSIVIAATVASAVLGAAALLGAPYTAISSGAAWIGRLAGLCAWLAMLRLAWGVIEIGGLRIAGWVYVTWLILFPFAGEQLVVGLNGLLDFSAPGHHRTRVISTDLRSARGRQRPFVRLEGWRQGMGEVEVPAAEWFVEGERVVVTTKPGCFGWEWIQNVARDGRRP
jgi:hypothetical protein